MGYKLKIGLSVFFLVVSTINLIELKYNSFSNKVFSITDNLDTRHVRFGDIVFYGADNNNLKKDSLVIIKDSYDSNYKNIGRMVSVNDDEVVVNLLEGNDVIKLKEEVLGVVRFRLLFLGIFVHAIRNPWQLFIFFLCPLFYLLSIESDKFLTELKELNKKYEPLIRYKIYAYHNKFSKTFKFKTIKSAIFK